VKVSISQSDMQCCICYDKCKWGYIYIFQFTWVFFTCFNVW